MKIINFIDTSRNSCMNFFPNELELIAGNSVWNSLALRMAFSIHMADRLRLSPLVKIQPGTSACAQVPATSDQHHLASKK